MRAYIDRFEQEVSALVAEEHYVQDLETRLPSSRTYKRRTLKSDYVLVKPADSLQWLGYRDVFEVDGEPVRGRDQRVVDILMTTEPDSLQRAAAFANESARYNLGPSRTVNAPTMPLQLMGRRHAGRLVVNVEHVRRNKDTADLTFFEPNPPMIIRSSDGRDIATRGELVVRLSDGAVLRGNLRFREARGPGDREAMMTVEYGPVPTIQVLVPVRMSEELPYEERGRLTGEATYSNYRKFQTTARIR